MKRDVRKKKHQELNADLEESMKRDLDSVKKPTLAQLVPCVLVTSTIYFIINTPMYTKNAVVFLQHTISKPPEPGR